MRFDEMVEAVAEAKRTLSAADNQLCAMVELITGRLRNSNASGYYLKKLKRELKSFNIHTGC